MILPWRLTFAVLGLLFAWQPASAQNDRCPSNSSPTGETVITNENGQPVRQVLCRCDAGYENVHGKCVEKLPVIDPSKPLGGSNPAVRPNLDRELTPGRQLAEDRARLEKLKQRRDSLRAALDRAIRANSDQQRYSEEIARVQQMVLYETVADVIGLLATGRVLNHLSYSADAPKLRAGLQSMILATDALAAENASDADRLINKAADLQSDMFRLIGSTSLDPATARTFNALVKSWYEAVKLIAHHEKGDLLSVTDAARSIFNVIGVVYEPVGIATKTIDAAGSAFVYLHIENARKALRDGEVSTRYGRLYLEQRLREIDDLIDFYDKQIARDPQDR